MDSNNRRRRDGDNEAPAAAARAAPAKAVTEIAEPTERRQLYM